MFLHICSVAKVPPPKKKPFYLKGALIVIFVVLLSIFILRPHLISYPVFSLPYDDDKRKRPLNDRSLSYAYCVLRSRLIILTSDAIVKSNSVLYIVTNDDCYIGCCNRLSNCGYSDPSYILDCCRVENRVPLLFTYFRPRMYTT